MPDTPSVAVRIPRLNAETLAEASDGGPLLPVHRRAAASIAEWSDALLAELEAASFRYYRDIAEAVGLDEPVLDAPEAIWEHVTLLGVMLVPEEDGPRAYVSVELNCTWEEEHGMEWVVRDDGAAIWVGPYEGFYPHSGEEDRGYLDPDYAG